MWPLFSYHLLSDNIVMHAERIKLDTRGACMYWIDSVDTWPNVCIYRMHAYVALCVVKTFRSFRLVHCGNFFALFVHIIWVYAFIRSLNLIMPLALKKQITNGWKSFWGRLLSYQHTHTLTNASDFAANGRISYIWEQKENTNPFIEINIQIHL